VDEHFDVGPLLWVKDDINQSLDSVLESVETIKNNAQDTAGMRFAQTYLYQVSGALDMVGLEGCKHYCNQLEKFAEQLEKKVITADADNLELFVNAINALKAYIERLVDGAVDIPSRLHPVLAPLVAAMGESIEESELFFPNTSPSVPNSVLSKELSEHEYTTAMLQQRTTYQKSLLVWMQSQSVDAISAMYEALSQVAFAQHNKRVKTLWWAASAFIETLKSPKASDNLAAKKVCRKLDQALRQLVTGDERPNNQLLRDILYFVATSDVETDTIAEVKTVFLLDGLVDKEATTASFAPLDADTLILIADLQTEIKALHDIWQNVSDSIDLEEINANSDIALVELDNVLITQFADKLDANQTWVGVLNQDALMHCYQALLQASIVLRDSQNKVSQGALVEVASALILLDSALTNYQTIDANMIQHLNAEAERLKLIETGFEYSQVEVVKEARLDKPTIAAVVKDIGSSLKVVEQSLDTFFRKPEDKATLSLTHKPLKQVAAIFDMLNLPMPMQVVNACNHTIQYFQQDEYDENQADFELLAESLAIVGLYADEMPNVRARTLAILEEKLSALNKTLSLAEVAISEEVLAALTDVEDDQPSVNPASEPLLEEVDAANQLLDQAFDEELLDIYLTEAEEILAHIAQNLQALRVNATAPEPLMDVRRNYHTLKGSGRTVGLAAQAEVASSVERFLNTVLDQEDFLTATQIAQLEKITAAFADWTADLRANSQALINQQHWLNQVAALYPQQSTEIDKEAPSAEADQSAYVLISGKHKVSRPLYDIFLNESMQHLVVIEQDIARLKADGKSEPAKRAKQAVHTLASNALASGFKPMGELCRALESWLDVVNWTPESLILYENVSKAIARMWQSISKLKMPRSARALVRLLNEASEQVEQAKAIVPPAADIPLPEEVVAVADDPVVINPLAIEPEAIKFSDAVEDEVAVKQVNAELVAMFVEEANVILPELGTTLRDWKAAPEDKQHSEMLQRLLHTLKGSARMAGQTEVGNIAHQLEEVIEKTAVAPTALDFETMFIALDDIVGFFNQPAINQMAENNVPADSIVHQVQPIQTLANQAVNFLRVREEILDHLINDAGEVSIIRSQIEREVVGFKASSNDLTDSIARLRSYLRELEIEAETQMQSRMNILQEANEAFDPLEFDRFTRLQELTRMMAESVNDVGTIQSGLLANLGKTEAALQQQSRMSRDLQQGLLGVRMLPFQHISERMQRIVRQTARELNKSVDLIIEGEATKIDRGVLEKVSASLEHLLRNAVAHGIEAKAERVSSGKPEVGIIRLLIRAVNDEIQMTLSDDGAGVNLVKVKEKAIQNGLLAPDADIAEGALLSIIFEPSFSTESETTQIAGRGVGLDVVRNDISGLGGRIDLSSEMGKGAIFNIYVPVTQSVAQVLMVHVGDSRYALPVAMIEQAQKVKHHDLLAAYSAGKVQWNGVDYPTYHLAQLLNVSEHQIEEQPYASVLLLRSGLHTIALHVDEVIGNQEVVMKEIGTQLARVPGIVGATVTGDGDIVLIVNPVVMSNRSQLALGSVSVNHVSKQNKTRVLVVDDSLTMRKVLGRLLEREGYDVQVATDGMDAMELLKVATPDIILTDIEMPRLDGFGLARNIRDDARTANTPLIMISSRTADKHKNLAKEIGVDAFFGKPVQDEALIAEMKILLASK
jgi:chemosensory pili system protein ChpA (sensor histidine kinase/response regulator)